MAKTKTNKPFVITSKRGKDKVKETKKTDDAMKKPYNYVSPKYVADNIFAKIVEKSKKSIMPSSRCYDFNNADERTAFAEHVVCIVKSITDANHKYAILNTNELVDLQKKFDDLQSQYEAYAISDFNKALDISKKLTKTGEELTNAIYLHNCVKTNLYNLTCEFYRRYICNAINGKLWEKLCDDDSDEVNFIVNFVCELDRRRFINDGAVKSGIAKPVPLVEWLVFAYTTENNSEYDIAKETLERLGYID